jgi:hypothetical protein
MKMGAREFLFLWSEALKRGHKWPYVLHTSVYDPSLDRISWEFKGGHFSRVTREGSESCDILKKHGLTQDDIDEAVKNYLEDA